MNILVTGASGFVGGAIMSGLKNENNVVGIGRRDLPCCGYDYHRADISELSSLEEILGIIKPDVIVHSAAAISHDGLDKSLIDTNVRGTANVLNLARMAGCKKIIYISGAPIIGSPTEIPVTEDHEVYPLSVYHLTKYFGEVLFQEAADMRTAILRLPSPIGAGMPENKILPVFIRNCLSGLPIKLLGEGRRLQNYINVRDVAVAVRRTIQCDVTGIFNVT